jgi:preprotein translocase subunit SecB
MTETASQEQQAPVFSIVTTYVKDLSLEVPNGPSLIYNGASPQIDLKLNTQATVVGDGLFEVVVTSTVTAQLPEHDNKVVFLIEARQAGVFQIRNVPEADLEPMLSVVCPNILYPYLREVVSDASVRAGFTPVLLNPINFEALYLQQQQQQAQEQAGSTH